jgi:hypothetical protein
LYARKQAADDVAARTNARRHASVRAAEELSERLRELADYLARHTSPRSVEIRPAAKWYQKPFMSPTGFILKFHRGLGTSVLVLLPDGRLWQQFSQVASVKDGEVVDLHAEFDDPHRTSRSRSVTIGEFSFFADAAGNLCARTLNMDRAKHRAVDPTEALATIAANVLEGRVR